ncbi:hypothetical protein ACWC0C_29590 [Streptomyces sp. NPDC001709]
MRPALCDGAGCDEVTPGRWVHVRPCTWLVVEDAAESDEVAALDGPGADYWLYRAPAARPRRGRVAA